MKTHRNHTVSIEKPVYAMASADGQSAEITMYGTIYEQTPTDWDGNPIEGQFITLSEFLADLDKIAGCKDISVRINSYGGDAGVSNTIHNRLRELVRDGAKVSCVVDGVAMSGGSLIMCACDPVKVNPSSLIMIHKCWGFMFGGYNADELREIAAEQDAWDKMQAEIYTRKTGLSNAVVMHMMSDTTYMTGREAVEKGFADELLEDAAPTKIAASADGRALVVNGRTFHLVPGMFAPEDIPTVTTEASAADDKNKLPEDTGEGGKQMPKTLDEFRAENSELAAQLEAEARTAVISAGTPGVPTEAAEANATDPVLAERTRLQEIDALADLFDADTVREAKYGATACTAQEMVYSAAQKAAKTGSAFLAALDADASESGANDVSAAATTPGDGDSEPKTPGQRMTEARSQVKALLGKKED